MDNTLRRQNDGWLQTLERPTLQWLARHMPACITPDRLTVIGLLGAVLCLVSYALAAHNPCWLWIASLGLAVNWFGDSLDGTLARHRDIQRPRYGYFLDNSVDLVEQFLISIGVGLSGFIRWDLSFLALAAFLMMSVLTLLRVNLNGTYQLTYGGIGPTEMRVAGVALNTLIFFVPPERFDGLGLPMTYPNLLSLAWSCGALSIFAISMMRELRDLARDDPAPRR